MEFLYQLRQLLFYVYVIDNSYHIACCIFNGQLIMFVFNLSMYDSIIS